MGIETAAAAGAGAAKAGAEVGGAALGAEAAGGGLLAGGEVAAGLGAAEGVGAGLAGEALTGLGTAGATEGALAGGELAGAAGVGGAEGLAGFGPEIAGAAAPTTGLETAGLAGFTEAAPGTFGPEIGALGPVSDVTAPSIGSPLSGFSPTGAAGFSPSVGADFAGFAPDLGTSIPSPFETGLSSSLGEAPGPLTYPAGPTAINPVLSGNPAFYPGELIQAPFSPGMWSEVGPSGLIPGQAQIAPYSAVPASEVISPAVPSQLVAQEFGALPQGAVQTADLSFVEAQPFGPATTPADFLQAQTQPMGALSGYNPASIPDIPSGTVPSGFTPSSSLTFAEQIAPVTDPIAPTPPGGLTPNVVQTETITPGAPSIQTAAAPASTAAAPPPADVPATPAAPAGPAAAAPVTPGALTTLGETPGAAGSSGLAAAPGITGMLQNNPLLAASLGLGVAGIASSAFNKTPYESQLNNLAAQQAQFTQQQQDLQRQLTAPLLTGRLPPDQQAIVDRALQDAISTTTSRYAQLGLGNSTALADQISSLKLQAQTVAGQLEQQMATTGQAAASTAAQAFNLQNSIFLNLMQAQMQQDAALRNAIASFAGQAGIASAIAGRTA